MRKINFDGMNLGQLLDIAQYHRVLTESVKEYPELHVPYNVNVVKVGNFVMQCHSHSTGLSCRVYIVGDHNPYKILDGTYWRASGYDNNSFFREYGAWDDAFDNAVETLRTALKDRHLAEEKEKADAEAKKKEKELELKRTVEMAFLGKDSVGSGGEV